MISFSGAVIKGKGEGRVLGYPTANIDYATPTPPDAGIWTCMIHIKEDEYQGLAVVDMWKLSNGLPSVEVHLFNFNQDLYGQVLTVTLLAKIRDLMQFTDTESLIIQIKKDIAIAEAAFETRI